MRIFGNRPDTMTYFQKDRKFRSNTYKSNNLGKDLL